MADKGVKIDLDAGTILLDSRWQSQEDLKQIDANIAALEQASKTEIK